MYADSASPLWIAANSGLHGCLRLLLDTEGAMFDNQAPDGTTAFDIALGHGDITAVSMLLNSVTLEPETHMIELALDVLENNHWPELESDAVQNDKPKLTPGPSNKGTFM